MKTKFFSALVILMMCILTPLISANYYTDKDIEYQAGEDGNYIYPTSIEPVWLKGCLSYTNRTIVNTFYFDLGQVTFQVVNANEQVVIAEQATAVAGGNHTVSLDGLEAGKYKICCLIPGEKPQVAEFELFE